ncbi:MAG: hypothetical protein O9304_06945 [Microcystis sp. LE19-114.1B]|nr:MULTISPECIES: hypothetical protein [unclassified Microcystis]MCZ8126643.1 hypothetical protein [Microcystis sp. LE19-114.1B]
MKLIEPSGTALQNQTTMAARGKTMAKSTLAANLHFLALHPWQ